MHRLDKDATIYNYTLAKKIRHRPVLLIVYSLIPFVGAIVSSLIVSGWIMAWFLGTLVALPCLYSVLTFLYLRIDGNNRGAWSILFRFPWIGLLPTQFVPVHFVRHVHIHLFWISGAAIVLLYPWILTPHLAVVLSLHMWFMLPRLWILTKIQSKKPGLLKISPGDTSCYVD